MKKILLFLALIINIFFISITLGGYIENAQKAAEFLFNKHSDLSSEDWKPVLDIKNEYRDWPEFQKIKPESKRIKTGEMTDAFFDKLSELVTRKKQGEANSIVFDNPNGLDSNKAILIDAKKELLPKAKTFCTNKGYKGVLKIEISGQSGEFKITKIYCSKNMEFNNDEINIITSGIKDDGIHIINIDGTKKTTVNIEKLRDNYDEIIKNVKKILKDQLNTKCKEDINNNYNIKSFIIEFQIQGGEVDFIGKNGKCQNTEEETIITIENEDKLKGFKSTGGEQEKPYDYDYTFTYKNSDSNEEIITKLRNHANDKICKGLNKNYPYLKTIIIEATTPKLKQLRNNTGGTPTITEKEYTGNITKIICSNKKPNIISIQKNESESSTPPSGDDSQQTGAEDSTNPHQTESFKADCYSKDEKMIGNSGYKVENKNYACLNNKTYYLYNTEWKLVSPKKPLTCHCSKDKVQSFTPSFACTAESGKMYYTLTNAKKPAKNEACDKNNNSWSFDGQQKRWIARGARCACKTKSIITPVEPFTPACTAESKRMFYEKDTFTKILADTQVINYAGLWGCDKEKNGSFIFINQEGKWQKTDKLHSLNKEKCYCK